MNKEELEHNVKSGSQWLRLLHFILFAVVFYIGSIVLFWITLFQFLHALISSKPNKQVQNFGSSLSKYFHEMIAYFTYVSDKRPFPFSDWPKAEKIKEAAPAKKTEEDTKELPKE